MREAKKAVAKFVRQPTLKERLERSVASCAVDNTIPDKQHGETS